MSQGKTNRNRGFSFERELVVTAKKHGFEAERAYGSNGKALGECEQVDCVVEDFYEDEPRLGELRFRLRIQAKRVKKLAAKYKIPEGCDAVIFREDRDKPLIMLDYERFLELVG